MELQSMTQAQKDELLAQLMQKEARHQALEKAKANGLSWSTNGLITVRMPKVGDKNQASLYINPANVNYLSSVLTAIQDFATTTGPKQ